MKQQKRKINEKQWTNKSEDWIKNNEQTKQKNK